MQGSFKCDLSSLSTPCSLQDGQETRRALFHHHLSQLLPRGGGRGDKRDSPAQVSALQPHRGNGGGMPLLHHSRLGKDRQRHHRWGEWDTVPVYVLQLQCKCIATYTTVQKFGEM